MSGSPRACVMGWPVAHSRSPLIHGHWLATLGLPGSYVREAVEPEAFAAFVAAMPERGFAGGNVTIPHKEAAARLCRHLTPVAARLGSVNTLWWRDGDLHGDSTDGAGFLGALDQEAPGLEASGWTGRRAVVPRAVVIGAGGAARAIVDALVARGLDVAVVNRTFERAEALTAALGGRAAGLDALPSLLEEADLLVNTTAAGMAGQPALPFGTAFSLAAALARLPDHAVVDDIVYVPAVTPLLAEARRRGLRTVGGLGMLLHQAVPGFARWFGRTPTVTPALRALVEADIRGPRDDRPPVDSPSDDRP